MMAAVLWGAGLLSLMQLGLWLWQVRTHNAGWVDVGWALGLAVMALLAGGLGPAPLERRLLLGLMGGLHGLRLGLYLWRRVATEAHEDGRYQAIRAAWKTGTHAKFFAFFQVQALLDVCLGLPFLLAAWNPRPGLHPLEWSAAALWLLAWLGEATADAQLRRFKGRAGSPGLTCREGLWRYSRHPNYFFEWLVWVAYLLLALSAPWGWTALVCPALMLYFLLRVTGIPYTEAQSLRSRPEDYARYQRETSAFIPWIPRKVHT
jgi:steroid 5-alpha reductase family enzyme